MLIHANSYSPVVWGPRQYHELGLSVLGLIYFTSAPNYSYNKQTIAILMNHYNTMCI